MILILEEQQKLCYNIPAVFGHSTTFFFSHYFYKLIS